MMRKIERKKLVLASKRQPKQIHKGTPVISCKRPQFNHYMSQMYSDFGPKHLASGGWKHSKAKQDFFTINPYKGVSHCFVLFGWSGGLRV